MCRALSKAARGGTFPRRRGGGAYQQPRPASLVGQPELLAAELDIGMDSTDEIDLTPLNEENNTVEATEVAIQTEYEEPIIRAPTPPPVPTRVHPPTSELAVQVDPEPELRPLTVNLEVQTIPEVLPVLSNAAIQWSPALVSVKDTGIQTIHATKSEMETQTPRFLTVEVETQTPKPPSLPLASIDPSASPVPRSSCRPITLSNASRSTVTPGSLPGALYREDSGEDTITYGRHFYRTDDEDENDGNETETGVETETDADNYQDARASIGVATPASFNDPDEYINARNTLNLVTPLSQVASASQDDFHSIMTPPAPASVPVPAPEAPLHPTPIPIPTPPAETAPIPPTNSQPVSPKPGFLYRVGPSNQQFQLVSPLSSPKTSVLPSLPTSGPQET